MNGAEMIAAERWRQTEVEGWDAWHDDAEHTTGELVEAAVCYALAGIGAESDVVPARWPWVDADWKPSRDGIVSLTKAGALIAAEIDRLLRARGATR
jgi:hypothetical protein